MKIKCDVCGHVHEGTIAKIGKPVKRGGEKQWISFCPECNHFIPVKVPNGKIVMLFACDDSEEYFTDNFNPANPMVSYYAFHYPKAFMDFWKRRLRTRIPCGISFCMKTCAFAPVPVIPAILKTLKSFSKFKKRSIATRHGLRRMYWLPLINQIASPFRAGIHKERKLL